MKTVRDQVKKIISGLFLISVFLNNIDAADCINSSLKLLTYDPKILRQSLLPLNGQPVIIGILIESLTGQKVLALGQQIGGGHEGLVYKIKRDLKIDPKKILWAGEIKLSQFNYNKLQISHANETAGILDKKHVGSLQLDKQNASVNNLNSFLNKYNPNLLADDFQKITFNLDNQHFDSLADKFSKFRHDFRVFLIHKTLLVRDLYKESNTKEIIAKSLEEMSEKMEFSNFMIKHIELQKGIKVFDDEIYYDLIRRSIKGELLSKDEYKLIIAKIEGFIKNYKEEYQLVTVD